MQRLSDRAGAATEDVDDLGVAADLREDLPELFDDLLAEQVRLLRDDRGHLLVLGTLQRARRRDEVLRQLLAGRELQPRRFSGASELFSTVPKPLSNVRDASTLNFAAEYTGKFTVPSPMSMPTVDVAS